MANTKVALFWGIYRTSFKAFMVSNTIAMVLASTSAFINLFTPLTKTKWKDYYFSKAALIFTLTASVTMILAFAAATYVVLGSSSVGVAIITTDFCILCNGILGH